MSEYKPTEYVVDFGDYRSNQFVRLSMALIEQNGANLGEQIVRCRDCKHYHDGTNNGRRYAEPHCLAIGELAYGALFEVDESDFCSWGEREGDE